MLRSSKLNSRSMSKKGTFKKGNIPWNRGKKNIHLSPSSEIKPGQWVGETHPSYVDGIQRMANDCNYVLTGNGKRVRSPRLIYEKHFGKIPDGYIVVHKDRDRYNDSPDNLEAISRAESLRRNAAARERDKTH